MATAFAKCLPLSLCALLFAACAQEPVFLVTPNEAAVPSIYSDLSSALDAEQSAAAFTGAPTLRPFLQRVCDELSSQGVVPVSIESSADGRFVVFLYADASPRKQTLSSFSGVFVFDTNSPAAPPVRLRFGDAVRLEPHRTAERMMFMPEAGLAPGADWWGVDFTTSPVTVARTHENLWMHRTPERYFDGRAAHLKAPQGFGLSWQDEQGRSHTAWESALGFRPEDVSPSGRFVSGVLRAYTFSGGRTFIRDSTDPQAAPIKMEHPVIWIRVPPAIGSR